MEALFPKLIFFCVTAKTNKTEVLHLTVASISWINPYNTSGKDLTIMTREVSLIVYAFSKLGKETTKVFQEEGQEMLCAQRRLPGP